MKKFFNKSGIDKFLSIGGGYVLILVSLFALAGCNHTGKTAKVEFVQPANGSLSAKIENGADITTGDSFKEGTVIIFTAIPSEGYKVDLWENAEATNADKTQAKLTVGKTAVKIKVTISAIPPKPATDGIVTFSAGEHGALKATVNGSEIQSGALQKAGTEILFTATPESGYKVANWEPNETDTIKLKSTDDKLKGTHTVIGDVTIKVNFAPLSKCKITFSQDASVPAGTTITATAGEGTSARQINSGDSINQGERIEWKASGFDETKYKAVWTIKRGGIVWGNTGVKPLPKNPLVFTGAYTNDGRDIDAVLKMEAIPTAKVCDKDTDIITVAGKTHIENAQPQYVYIKLTNDTFNTNIVTKCYEVGSWFTNLPAGLTAKTDCNETVTLTEENTKLRVQFFGIPTETKAETIEVTIPKECLTGGKTITATNNENAKFNITESFKITAGNITVNANDPAVTLKATAKIEVLYNPLAGNGLYKLQITDALTGITSKTSHKITTTFKIKGATTNESSTGNASISPKAPFNVTINGGIPVDKIKDDSTVTAQITVQKQGAVTLNTNHPIKAFATPKQAPANASVKITIPVNGTDLQKDDIVAFSSSEVTIPDHTITESEVTAKKFSITFTMPEPAVDVTITVTKK